MHFLFKWLGECAFWAQEWKVNKCIIQAPTFPLFLPPLPPLPPPLPLLSSTPSLFPPLPPSSPLISPSSPTSSLLSPPSPHLIHPAWILTVPMVTANKQIHVQCAVCHETCRKRVGCCSQLQSYSMFSLLCSATKAHFLCFAATEWSQYLMKWTGHFHWRSVSHGLHNTPVRLSQH